jgi:hypothetical protein
MFSRVAVALAVALALGLVDAQSSTSSSVTCTKPADATAVIVDTTCASNYNNATAAGVVGTFHEVLCTLQGIESLY